jgi:hypothetical protein
VAVPILRKDGIAASFPDGLTDLQWNGFRQQNVISALSVQRLGSGLQLLLDPCYELAGTLAAEAIRVEFQPGRPEDTDQL